MVSPIAQLCSNKQKVLTGHEQTVITLAWSNVGSLLASGSSDNTIKLWSLDNTGQNREIREFKGHKKSVEKIQWLQNDDCIIVSVSEDKLVKFWDTKSGQCLHTLTTVGCNISCACSPDGNQVAVSDKDDVLTLIDVRKMSILHSTAEFQSTIGQINEISWTNSGSHLCMATGYIGGNKGGCEFLKTSTGRFERELSLLGHTGNCYCLKFDPTSEYFALGSGDALVSLWDMKDMVCARSFTRSDGAIRSLDFSHDGKVIAYGSVDKMIYLDNVETGDPMGVVDISSIANLQSLAFHPSQYTLAYCGGEHKGTRGAFVRVAGATFK